MIILTKFSTRELYELVDIPKLFDIQDCWAGSGVSNGRFMLDNLITASENIEWAEESRQNALFLEIHFDKGFDKIEQGFISEI